MGIDANGRMRPDPDTIQRLQERGLTVEALPTSQAVRRFGELDLGPRCNSPPPHPLTAELELATGSAKSTLTSARAAVGPAVSR